MFKVEPIGTGMGMWGGRGARDSARVVLMKQREVSSGMSRDSVFSVGSFGIFICTSGWAETEMRPSSDAQNTGESFLSEVNSF